MKDKIFNENVIVHEDGEFFDFGISPITASLYGKKAEDIVEVEMKISENQEILENEKDIPTSDYWGWYDFEREGFTMIYNKRFILNMCFPYGIKSSEDAGKGKAYRLDIWRKNENNKQAKQRAKE